MIRYGESFVNKSQSKKPKKKTKKSASEASETSDGTNPSSYDFAALRTELQKTIRDLDEIKAEFRITAVTKATQIIQDSKDFKERLRAAYVVDFDGQMAVNFLRTHLNKETKFERPALQDPKTLSALLTAVQYARETAGDLATKSRLLYLGMHWWLRGRYGEGPHGAGLLKAPASLVSPLAQFPLYMPASMPTPVDPTEAGYSIPKYDRRHHYIWMYEYRDITSNETTRSNMLAENRDVDITVHSKTKLENFY
jgi:hypothetical protein